MTEHDEVAMAGPRLAVRVAELLRLALQSSGRSQREIAEALGVGDARVSQILNGDGNFHVATVARAFAAMGFFVDLKVYDEMSEELRIRPRVSRRKPEDVTYVHPVQTADGSLARVFSYAPRRVAGRPVDFVMDADDVPSSAERTAGSTKAVAVEWRVLQDVS